MKNKSDWPKEVTVGNATVKIYKRITSSGKVGFQIVYKDTDGKRKFEAASEETQAVKVATKKAETLSTFGARVAGTQSKDMAEFCRAADMLKPFNVSLGSAVDRVAGWLTKLGTLDAIDRAIIAGPVTAGMVEERTVEQAVAEFLTQKKANGISESYKRDLKFRLTKFAGDFKCNVSGITAPQIQNWLDTQKMNATSYNNFRRVIGVLMGYCAKRGFRADNPLQKIETRKRSNTVTEIYTPGQLEKLLTASTNGFQLMLAICGFAGLRSAEFERLTWADIDFTSSHIVIGADKAKTKSRRLVPMSANLRAWLEPFKGHTGKVWQAKRIMRQRQQCAKLAGVPWLHNALRHSFCSYRLAQSGDAPRTAFEAGNSPAMIDRHYKALVTEQAARDWFAIVPPATPATKPV